MAIDNSISTSGASGGSSGIEAKPAFSSASLTTAARRSRPEQTSVLPGSVEDPSSWTNRFWGLLKAGGGVLEGIVGTACAAAASWTGIGAVAGGAVALHGADTAISGLREIITGGRTATFTSQGISALTGSETAGEVADAAAGLLGTAGVGTFSKITAAEPLAAKTVTWTRELFPGSGYTGPFGDVVVSKLGTALDRAQVLVHEKVHSFLSPGRDDLFPRFRADLRSFLYQKSSLMRYAEEAAAETAAQLATRQQSGMSTAEALRAGLAFPVEYGYVKTSDVILEGAGAASKTADAVIRTNDAINGESRLQ